MCNAAAKKQLKGEGAACNTGMCGRMHGCNGFWFNMWPLRSSDRVACVHDINLTEHVHAVFIVGHGHMNYKSAVV